MSVTTAAAPARQTGLSGALRWHRPLMWFAAAMVVWAVVCSVGLIMDQRTLAGAPIWAKPLKFTLSLTIYAVTLAWMLSLVRRPMLRRAGWVAGTIGAAASLVEITVISLQVLRGTASHFNVATPFDAALYALMGSGAVIMYGATLIVGGVLAFFTVIPDRALRWALRLGLLIGMTGLSVGFLMVVPTVSQLTAAAPQTMGSHSVGGDDVSGGLFFFGWNTVHGDLRVAHFIGMHAFQALPVLALLLAAVPLIRRAGESIRLRLVLFTAIAWASVTVLVLWQALRGQSVVNPDGATWFAIGGLLLTASLAAVVIIRSGKQHLRDPRHPSHTVSPARPERVS